MADLYYFCGLLATARFCQHALTAMNAASRIAIGIIALSAWIAQAEAPRFASDRLERIAARVGVEDSAEIELRGIGRVPLRVDSDTVTGEIRHIGVRVFSERQRQMAPSPVYDFLERYTLEALLPGEHEKPLEKQLMEDDLEFSELDLHGIALMSLDSVEQPATITCLGGRRYRVEWPYAKGRSRAVDFPVNHRLLLGQDMDELERRLVAKLQAHADALGGPLLDGRHADIWEGRRSAAHTEDTILAKILDANPHAIVTMLAYGGNKIIEIPLSWLLHCLDAEGCVPSASSILCDNPNTVKLLILENHPSLGYCHSVRVEADTAALATGERTVKVRLAPYLPMSKVENLFYENQVEN